MADLAIAVDGPASSGKGTVARRVAEALGYAYVDTGAMYRAVGLFTLRAGGDPADAAAAERVARSLAFSFAWSDGTLRVFVGSEDVSGAIRGEGVGSAASIVAAHPGVRAALLDAQRALGAGGRVVMDGRDIGTVVLPGAGLKSSSTRRWRSGRAGGRRSSRGDARRTCAASLPSGTRGTRVGRLRLSPRLRTRCTSTPPGRASRRSWRW